MDYGNKATDGGGLIMTLEQKNKIIEKCPEADIFIKKLIGSSEFIRGNERYCLWIADANYINAKRHKVIQERFDIVEKSRLASTKQNTRLLAELPYKFEFISYNGSNSLIIPRVSSERREYIPIGFLDSNTIILDSAQAIYNAEPFMLSILSSKIHMNWVRAVSGYLGTSIRYSGSLCYNNFPFPPISKQRKEELTQCTLKIIDERLKHSEKTLAQLYDPDKMPEGLKEAHNQNDLAVERCYRSTPFNSDEERLEYLFKLYEKMIQEEKDKDTLFAKEKKTRKRK